jgi:hypothetical protein
LLDTEWTPARLAAVDADPAFALYAARWLGMPQERQLGEPFQCILPGHWDEHPSASFGCTDDGFIYYHDFHAPAGTPPLLTLAEVYYAQVTGKIAKLTKPLHAVWKLRLLHDIGVLEPAEVALPPLVSNALPVVPVVYEGLRLLVGLRWRVYTDREPVTYTYTFVTEWCGVSESSARRAVRTLVATDIIRKVDSVSSRGRTAPLYLPGSRRL